MIPSFWNFGPLNKNHTQQTASQIASSWRGPEVRRWANFTWQQPFWDAIRILVGGFNPSEKIFVKLGHLPQVGMKIKTNFETTTLDNHQFNLPTARLLIQKCFTLFCTFKFQNILQTYWRLRWQDFLSPMPPINGLVSMKIAQIHFKLFQFVWYNCQLKFLVRKLYAKFFQNCSIECSFKEKLCDSFFKSIFGVAYPQVLNQVAYSSRCSSVNISFVMVKAVTASAESSSEEQRTQNPAFALSIFESPTRHYLNRRMDLYTVTHTLILSPFQFNGLPVIIILGT